MEIKMQAQTLNKLNNTTVIVFTIKNKNKEVLALPGLVKNRLGIKIDSKLSWKWHTYQQCKMEAAHRSAVQDGSHTYISCARWKPHIHQLCKKLSSPTYISRRIKISKWFGQSQSCSSWTKLQLPDSHLWRYYYHRHGKNLHPMKKINQLPSRSTLSRELLQILQTI